MGLPRLWLTSHLPVPCGRMDVNDEMIAAYHRYIAAASVADLTNQPGELALPAAPRT